ncbi:nitrilase-related carbon-nitrogen hydrolase [Limisalsivibrio acetivorans]|uniref:nitrilase-related carbon-nitrogen hydrolase n=1 Tax=Limisalsivibrio acetivorans TaxID=1304888 RepID=UPI0003B61CFB|nr:nitrilase-related carbon-nitrogen hydrolase [Limisalsivibrio acetivorans]
MKIVSIQLPVHLGDVEANKKTFLGKLPEVIGDEPSIIIFPEMWVSGFDYERLLEFSTKTDEICREISSQLNQNSLVISAMPEGIYNKVYNTIYAVSSKGVEAKYRKNFLFSPLGENKYIERGKGVSVFEFNGAKIGLQVCYEIRFPELFRTSAFAGAELICVPAIWPEMKKNHWLTLLKARAVENQCYIAGCNTSVMHTRKKDMECGYSVTWDPWGEAAYEPVSGEGVFISEFDPEKVRDIRKKIPSFEDAKKAFTIKRKD